MQKGKNPQSFTSLSLRHQFIKTHKHSNLGSSPSPHSHAEMIVFGVNASTPDISPSSCSSSGRKACGTCSSSSSSCSGTPGSRFERPWRCPAIPKRSRSTWKPPGSSPHPDRTSGLSRWVSSLSVNAVQSEKKRKNTSYEIKNPTDIRNNNNCPEFYRLYAEKILRSYTFMATLENALGWLLAYLAWLVS